MTINTKTIALYRALFVTRDDTFALQKPGWYVRVPLPVTDLLIRTHLEGHVTVGWYALNGDTCRWLCLDADTGEEWRGLHRLQQVMAGDGLPSHLEHSRRGGHLWLFFEEAVLATVIRRVVVAYLERLDLLVEVYPKQDRTHPTCPYGSLVRGPCGVHRLTGRRYPFAMQGSTEQQLQTLWEQRAPTKLVRDLDPGPPVRVETVRYMPGPPRGRRPGGHSPIARLNQVLDVWELAGQVTDLNERTGMGSCPFHPPDRHPSFGVNRREQWWIDFHGRDGRGGPPVGGDAFELYCRLNGIGHREGIARLAYLL